VAPSPETLAPLVKTVGVPLAPAEAFDLFTNGLVRWWPLSTHSVTEAEAVDCVMEGRVGGRIFERAGDGSEHVWGTVEGWETPRRLAFTWHPGRPADSAQTIDVRFDAAAHGGTTVTLVHGGWDALGDRAATMRSSYDSGWDFVLGEYVETASGDRR
jgi:uncharacterized protein YndB with AHSA1/START domain